MHEREDLGIGRLSNSLAGVQEIEFHEESHARKLCTELLDEVGLRHRRATRGNQVVNDKHHIVFVKRVGMDFEAVGSVFKLIAFAAHFTRQLAGRTPPAGGGRDSLFLYSVVMAGMMPPKTEGVTG